MRIDIRGRGVQFTAPLLEHIERRLRENARLAIPRPPASLPGDAFDVPKN